MNSVWTLSDLDSQAREIMERFKDLTESSDMFEQEAMILLMLNGEGLSLRDIMETYTEEKVSGFEDVQVREEYALNVAQAYVLARDRALLLEVRSHQVSSLRK